MRHASRARSSFSAASFKGNSALARVRQSGPAWSAGRVTETRDSYAADQALSYCCRQFAPLGILPKKVIHGIFKKFDVI